MTTSWIFDPAPPSGRRTGGNAAEYNFAGTVETLIRETAQNSLDAYLPQPGERDQRRPVYLRFRLLSFSEDDLANLQNALDWNSLADNLAAVPERRGGLPIQRAIKAIEERSELRAIAIEDYNTRGLNGSEIREDDNERNPFCALVRDELYSDKDDPDAGGSFGLGKSVLWSFSGIKTVLFATVPSSPPPPHTGLRLIGRASLPYHETLQDGRCSGAGWFGVERRVSNGFRRAESVWGGEAHRIAAACRCDRPDPETGLTALILGFTEPGHEDRELPELLNAVADSAFQHFWPAIVRQRLSVKVTHENNGEVVGEREVDSAYDQDYEPAVELLTRFYADDLPTAERLEEGEAALAWVPIEVPECISEEDRHPAFTGQVALAVRVLTEAEANEKIRDKVFRFRKPGMVVHAARQSAVSLSARPYVALVIAGRACGDSEEHERIERFLRAAEPPAHDDWVEGTRQIKDHYRAHGVAAKLKRFNDAIRATISELVSKPDRKGGSLPASLLRFLRFGDESGGGNPRFLSVTGIVAKPEAGTWVFRAHCRRIRPDDSPWFVKVRFKYAVDGGGSDDIHAIDQVTSDRATRAEVRGGIGYLQFPPEVKSAKIEGRVSREKLPPVGTRAAVRLRVDGERGELPDA